LSVEEFHGKLQAATNFPLRPFAVPFLKVNIREKTRYLAVLSLERIRMHLRQCMLCFQSTLPVLQKEISTLASRSKQSTSQFIAQHEELIFLARDTLEQETNPPDEQRKRKRSHE
jgi:hypothetical protein